MVRASQWSSEGHRLCLPKRYLSQHPLRHGQYPSFHQIRCDQNYSMIEIVNYHIQRETAKVKENNE